MKLKKLTITGFKSFADRVVIDFDHEVIAIVGPNGCGKSNIVDAFRWVMGEQSAKSLRGDKMYDVLFAGSEHRKALNYAEVSVWLSDTNDQLLLPYDEVTVTRRLHRSGESEYFINKNPVRLKEIQELFLGSGIGKNAFSIFEQGKLDQIIHLNPLERRVIFDEAAGTSRFLQKKRESIRKLALINENFVRVCDIHAEVEKQAKQLKKQAGHAKNYQESKNRLEYLEKGVLITQWHIFSKKNEDIEEQITLLTQTIDNIQLQINHIEQLYHKSKTTVVEEENLFKQNHQKLNQHQMQSSVLASEIKQQTFRLLELKKREQNIQTHLKELIHQNDEIYLTIKHSELLLNEATEKKEWLQNSVEQEKTKYSQLEHQVTTLRSDLKKSQEQYLKSLREERDLSTELQERLLHYQSRCSHLHALKETEKQRHQECSDFQEKIAEQSEKIKILSEQIDLLKSEHHIAEKQFLFLRKQHLTKEEECETCLRKITELQAHQKVLIGLKEEMEGFSASAKSLLQEAKNKKSPLYQKIEPLIEYLIPQQGLEHLFATAMRTYAETLVVASRADFATLIDYAKTNRISDFSVLIKEDISAKKLHDLNSLETNVICRHLTSLLQVISEKHFLDHLGVYFYVDSSKKTDNVFLRQGELRSIHKALDALNENFNQQSLQRQTLLQEIKEAEKKRNASFEIQRKKEMDLIQENFHLQQFLADLERVNKELSAMKKETASLDSLAQEEQAVALLKEKQTHTQSQVNNFLEKLKAEESVFDNVQEEMSQARQALEKIERLSHDAKLDWQKYDQEIKLKQAKLHHIGSHEKKLIQEQEELQHLIEKSINTIALQEKESAYLASTVQALHNRVQEQEERVCQIKKESEMLEKELVQKRKILVEPEKQRHTLEITLAQIALEKQKIEQELNTTSMATLSPLNERVEEVTQEIHRLRTLLQTTSCVNMTAIDEFQVTQQRFEYLDTQLKDLKESKEDLEQIIAKLDQESRKIFKKTFLQIRENFQKNFSILFSGGTADITFTESSDILEAGIEIVAKPPGKQMRAISLLSGGEKCLTALALLFSIFEVKPAPFCILDEVDAPLDDSNIDRFTQMLREFTRKTQFIIVTHNKKSMAIADLLIGVSMEQKGVSTLISLTLEKSLA